MVGYWVGLMGSEVGAIFGSVTFLVIKLKKPLIPFAFPRILVEGILGKLVI